MRRYTLLIMLTAAAAGCRDKPAITWETYTGAPGAKIEFPGHPVDETGAVGSRLPDGTPVPRGVRTMAVKFGASAVDPRPSTCAFSVFASGAVDAEARATMLEAGLKANRRDGTVLAERPLRVAGADGRELELRTNAEFHRWTRLYVNDTHVFVVLCEVPQSRLVIDEPVVRRLLDSFKLDAAE